jgi:glutathione transport system substrate-binding protein
VPFDVAKAKELLKEAGYPNGFETEIFAGNNTTSIRAMQFLQQQFAQVNVKLKVTPLEAGVAAQKIWGVSKPEDTTVQLYNGGWSASTGDTDWQMRPLLFGESFPPKMFNVAYFSNPDVDAGIKAGIATADNEKRAEAYKTAQEAAWKNVPRIYLGVERLLATALHGSAGDSTEAIPSLCLSDADRLRASKLEHPV